MNIKEEENSLFRDWSSKRAKLSQDGMIDEKYYLASNPKLLFLLKEVNSNSEFDLREFVKEGGRSQTWDNIARWTYGIRNLQREVDWKELVKVEKRQELLKYICVMNLKKSPGGHTNDKIELKKIAQDDEDFLNKQFQIYFADPATRPDFIIACGSTTSAIFNSVIKINNKSGWKLTKRGVWFYKYDTKRYFISYAHPEARIQSSLLYYGLIDTIKELTSLAKD